MSHLSDVPSPDRNLRRSTQFEEDTVLLRWNENKRIEKLRICRQNKWSLIKLCWFFVKLAQPIKWFIAPSYAWDGAKRLHFKFSHFHGRWRHFNAYPIPLPRERTSTPNKLKNTFIPSAVRFRKTVRVGVVKSPLTLEFQIWDFIFHLKSDIDIQNRNVCSERLISRETS